METSVLGKRRVGDEFTGPQKRLMSEPIMDVATEADLQKVTRVNSSKLDDGTLRQMGNERPYKLINKNSSMLGLENTDADLGDNPFGLDLNEPLPQKGGRKYRRNKRKSSKRKSHKKRGGKRTRRNKKGSRRHRK